MRKNILPQVCTHLWQKIALIILGLFLTLAALEIGLRLTGIALVSLQEYRNYLSIKQKGTYRIMCIGESTTAGQYPPFLEKILNQRNPEIKFTVIDKGIPGTCTSKIVSLLEDNLNKYNPDIVVVMMGENDSGICYMFHESPPPSMASVLFRSFKSYKLFHLLWLHIATKAKQINSVSGEESLKGPKKINFLPNVELGWFYFYHGRYSEAEEIIKKAIKINPENDMAYHVLGLFYNFQHRYPEAEESLKKAIKINPKNLWFYVELGWFYFYHGRYSEAEEIIKKAIKINPEKDRLYVAVATLSAIYREWGKHELSEEYSKKAGELKTKYYPPATVNNYRKVKEMVLDQRKIRLICLQYPMCNVEQLKRIFQSPEGIIFVDNEKVFKNALKKASYREYFIDRFAGGFGHCTEKGNKLLAEQIASVILEEVFSR